MSSKIITLRDRITQKSTYPITSVRAVITDEGRKLVDIVEEKINQVNILLAQAISKATAAEESVAQLGELNTSNVSDKINQLADTIEEIRLDMISLKNNYKELESIATKTINADNLTRTITGEASKIPTTSAVRNYIAEQAKNILDNLIDTTYETPNYTPGENGKILVNPETGEVFISSGGNSNVWYKFNSTKLVLEDSEGIESEIINGTLYLNGDVKVESQTITLTNKEGDVVDDSIIL